MGRLFDPDMDPPDDDELDACDDTYPDPEYDAADLEPEPLGREADFLYDPIRYRGHGFE